MGEARVRFRLRRTLWIPCLALPPYTSRTPTEAGARAICPCLRLACAPSMSSAVEEVTICIDVAEKAFGAQEHRRVAFIVGPSATRITGWRVIEVACATCCKEYIGQNDNSVGGKVEAGEGGLFRSQLLPSSPQTTVRQTEHFNGVLTRVPFLGLGKELYPVALDPGTRRVDPDR